MVKMANSILEGNPNIDLDMEAFRNQRSSTPEDVEQVLLSKIDEAHKFLNEEEQDGEDIGASIERSKARIKYEACLREYDEVFKSNPELYTSLYDIKEATNHELDSEGHENSRAKIQTNEDGNLFLTVDILRPSEVSFQIHDGKLCFDPTGMTKEQLKEIIYYLDRRGLVSCVDLESLTLNDADEKTLGMFEKAKEDVKNESGEDTTVQTQSENPLEIEQDDKQEQLTPLTEGMSASKEPVKDPDAAYEGAIASLTKWMNKNKRLNLSYFVTHEKGYVVFTTFEKENPDNMDLDNIVDSKSKDVKTRHECKIYVKNKNDGKLEVSFSVNGKVLSDSYADRIMDAYKDAGITRVKFGKMDDANEGCMRSACGRALIVPIGLKLSQTKFDKIIDAAEGKYGKNNPKVIKYRLDLAKQFAYQLSKKGIEWNAPENRNISDCRTIRYAYGAYNYSPFRDWWEDFGLRGEYEKILKHGNGKPADAASSVGAAMAVAKLYKAYDEAITNNANVSYLISPDCETLSKEEKDKFKEYLNGKEDVPLRSMPADDAIKLFKIMQEIEERKAKKTIEDEYRALATDPHYKGNVANDAVRKHLSHAKGEIEDVKTQLSDLGLPPIVILNPNEQNYDFSEVRRSLGEKGSSGYRRSSGEYNNRRNNNREEEHHRQGNNNSFHSRREGGRTR